MWFSLYAIKPKSSMVCASDQEVDWRQVYIDYLREGSLPMERTEAARVVRGARCFFLEKGFLFRRTLNGMPQRCVDKEEAEEVLRRTHRTEHQGWRKLYEQLVQLGYFWPTMEIDSKRHVRRYQACQKFRNLVSTLLQWSYTQSVPYTLFIHGLWTWLDQSLQPHGRIDGSWRPRKFVPNGLERLR